MRLSIRTSLFLILMILSVNSYAGDAAVKPVNRPLINKTILGKLDSFITSGNDQLARMNTVSVATGAGRICSCQILNLASSNYDHRRVVLLAEKTNDGSGEVFEIARKRILKEKKLLKNLFYDKIELVSEVQGTGSCKAMFSQLSAADKNLKLYEILNAD